MNTYGVKPNKRLGQNFLTDKSAVKNIIKAANLKKSDLVLEIGPGLGVLTKELARNAKKVIALEKDKNLCKILKQELKEYDNVEIINTDALKDDYDIPAENYKLIANLPFNVASAIIRKFLEEKNSPAEMILMVQKEVAQRITAKPPNMSILAISVQLYAKPKTILHISKKSFYPKPKVDAAVLRITPHTKLAPIQKELFFRIVKAGFSSPRKQLINNLSKGLKAKKEDVSVWLKKNNIEPNQRAETLSVEDWMKLTKGYSL